MSFDSMDFETLIDHVINKGDNNFINFLNVIKEVINISNKCIDELDNKLVEIDSDISDINYHAYNFLIRTNRIFISIIILLLFDRVEDAIILGRSFIENILQTIFMFNDKRGRSMRQIEIYNWLSLERYYEEIYKRSLTKFEERGLAKKPIKEFNNFEEIKKSIGQRLSKYPEREIERMRANFDNGKPWFGKRRRWGLKTYNLDSF